MVVDPDMMSLDKVIAEKLLQFEEAPELLKKYAHVFLCGRACCLGFSAFVNTLLVAAEETAYAIQRLPSPKQAEHLERVTKAKTRLLRSLETISKLSEIKTALTNL
jgi:hypothetical protein